MSPKEFGKHLAKLREQRNLSASQSLHLRLRAR